MSRIFLYISMFILFIAVLSSYFGDDQLQAINYTLKAIVWVLVAIYFRMEEEGHQP